MNYYIYVSGGGEPEQNLVDNQSNDGSGAIIQRKRGRPKGSLNKTKDNTGKKLVIIVVISAKTKCNTISSSTRGTGNTSTRRPTTRQTPQSEQRQQIC